MIRLPNPNDGFSIIEVIIAIAIIGTTLLALYASQSASARSVLRGHQTIQRLYLIKNQIYAQQTKFSEEVERTVEEKIAKPQTDLMYRVQKIHSESHLAQLQNLYSVQASGTWRMMGISFKKIFVGLLFNPPKKKQ